MAKAVVATIGEDQPGLVNRLSELIAGMNLNIEDSRMTVLGGEFAVLMSVAGDSALLSELETKLSELAAATGLAYLFRKTSDKPGTTTRRLRVKVEAMDHPGIVHSIAAFFSERGINIFELSTDTERAAHTGAPIFNLRMEIELPDDRDMAALRSEFAEYCEERDLDGDLTG